MHEALALIPRTANNIKKKERERGRGRDDDGDGDDGDAKLCCLLSLGLACFLNTLYVLTETSQQFYRELLGWPTFYSWLSRALETVMLWLCS